MLHNLIQPPPPEQGLSPIGDVSAVLSLRPARRELDQNRRYDRQNTCSRVNQQIQSNLSRPISGDSPRLGNATGVLSIMAVVLVMSIMSAAA